MIKTNHRHFIQLCAVGIVVLAFCLTASGQSQSEASPDEVLAGVKSFLYQVAHPDGSFRPGIDPEYKGMSDTSASGIAAPTYATILCRTFGWSLPYPGETKNLILSLQKPDGAFYAATGAFDPNAPLAKLYNTVQALVTLRLLGAEPKYDPTPVIEYFFQGSEFKELPLYTTSFFPHFYNALGTKMPTRIDAKMCALILGEQTEDGYLRNHVASTFHAAHYFRLTGRPTPKAKAMVDRVIRDQKDDGSWCHHPPDWDVHAAFDALFILRQLCEPDDPRLPAVYRKANKWILQCRKPDGGFSHYPQNPTSDVDAVYFHVGALVETGFLQPLKNVKHEELLGWGHMMVPGKTYSCIE